MQFWHVTRFYAIPAGPKRPRKPNALRRTKGRLPHLTVAEQAEQEARFDALLAGIDDKAVRARLKVRKDKAKGKAK